MIYNPIVRQAQNEFDELLQFVLQDSKNSQVNEIERGIWHRLLQIGYLLLKCYFQLRCQQYGREPLLTDTGVETPFWTEKTRGFYSIFGKLNLPRPYFYKEGQGGHSPLDQLLGLGKDCYSDMLREWYEELGVHMPYGQTAKTMARFFNCGLSTRAVQQLVTTDAVDVTPFYDKKAAPTAEDEGEIMVIQADGKGIPMLMTELNGNKVSRKKESIVTTLYTINPNRRSVDEVLATFFDETDSGNQSERNRPRQKQLWATLKGKDIAFQRLKRQLTAREGAHIQQRVALCDGDDALQSRLQALFPDFTLVLDFIHANEYLWDAANALWDEDVQKRDWVKQHTKQLLASQTEQLIADLRQQAQHSTTTPTQQAALTKAANYFTRNTPYMDYKTYLHNGWPIASGVIEGACRHLVKDRMELSGMRWVKPSAEALLQLRVVAENDDWDAYHAFRRQCQQRRLYYSEKSAEFIPTIYHQLPLAF